ncbi:MFS transporter [Puerhibacterium sp. TATVAM-FAB25]|uniref:MFS transporter n=1 Tax=Puerhibacterium sp. TATVAM-FAB25 TaxID=3093699 RepID=UPI00397E7AEF
MEPSPESVASPRPARPRDWAGLALLAVPCALISVNSNLLNLAMPALAAELRPSTAQLLWVSDVYVFLVAGLLLPMGLLADRFGRRRMLLAGAAVFGLASVGAALASTAGVLIAFRGLIGVGAAMLGPSTLSLIRSIFQVPAQRATALSIWTASFAVGGILGPLVGGLLIEVVSWRAVFAVTPPVMVVLLIFGPLLLPEHRSADVRRIDAVGTGTAIAGLLATVYAVKQLSAQSTPLAAVAVGVAGVALLVAFLRRQARVPDPVLDLSLFADRACSVPLAGNALAFAVLYGTQLLVGQYLQAVLGLTPLAAGLWTVPGAAAYAAGGLVAPRLAARHGARRVLAAGLAVSAAGFAVVAAVGTGSGLLAFVVGSVVYSVGLAPVYLVTTDASVAAVPAERAGVAGATLETVTNLGGALGIALFGSLAGAVYRAGAASAGVDTQTVGDAVGQAAALPAPQAADLLASAQAAFVAGFRLVEVVGAAILLVSAVLTARLLRRTDRRRDVAAAVRADDAAAATEPRPR